MEEIASAPDLSQRMEIFMKFLGGYVFEAWPGVVAFYALHVYEAIDQKEYRGAPREEMGKWLKRLEPLAQKNSHIAD
eukprot:1470642-Alexandrium_andersonii.AAC.1